VQWHKERLSLSDDTQLDMMSNPASIEHNIGVGLFLGESPAINETPAIIEQAETNADKSSLPQAWQTLNFRTV
jgi:hypothetical protein